MSKGVQPTKDTVHVDIRYSRMQAERIAIDLLTTAADALMHGTTFKPPQLHHTTATQDAITARSLQLLARHIYEHMTTITPHQESNTQ